jgi:hypothetical protein
METKNLSNQNPEHEARPEQEGNIPPLSGESKTEKDESETETATPTVVENETEINPLEVQAVADVAEDVTPAESETTSQVEASNEEEPAEIAEQQSSEEIIAAEAPDNEVEEAATGTEVSTEEPTTEVVAEVVVETEEASEVIEVENKEVAEEVVAETAETPVVTEPEEIPATTVSEVETESVTVEVESEIEVSEETMASDAPMPIVEESAAKEKVAEMPPTAEIKADAIPVVDSSDEDEDDVESEEVSEEIYQNLSREDLVELLENIVNQEDIQSIKVKVALIKVAFLNKDKAEQQAKYEVFMHDGGIEEDYSPEADQLSERFQRAFDIYRERKQRFNEEFEKEKLTNLEAKKKILEELKALISSEETLKKTYDEFKNLQDTWRAIGMVPKSEINQLWQNYHFLVEKFFDKVKINKELKDLDMKKNLDRKIEICEKAEELLIETSIIRSFKQLQQYHEDWKEVGPVPQDKKDEIWERFKTASDQINERRREYYDKKQSEFDGNHLAKLALCEKAEKVISTTPDTLKKWQTRTHEINDLLKVWKTIGPAPKKVNNEIWSRFKTCLDSHFTTYKEYLEKLKDHQLNNYNLKLDLCAQAEAMKHSTDWRKTSQELIKLQNEWKAIGPVPRKHSDKIWKRFRTACDEFFQRKQEFFSSVSEVENENLKKKEELIKQLQEFTFSDNRSDNLESLKNFQREWLEIGHVPIREKDRLHNEFRTVINKHFDKLKIASNEISAMNYKNRLESMRDNPDSGRTFNRERNALQIKISKMQEDIMLWENNIGFLAESKNANIVKVEFQKKIDQAKQELALLEAKLRVLRDV